MSFRRFVEVMDEMRIIRVTNVFSVVETFTSDSDERVCQKAKKSSAYAGTMGLMSRETKVRLWSWKDKGK